MRGMSTDSTVGGKETPGAGGYVAAGDTAKPRKEQKKKLARRQRVQCAIRGRAGNGKWGRSEGEGPNPKGWLRCTYHTHTGIEQQAQTMLGRLLRLDSPSVAIHNFIGVALSWEIRRQRHSTFLWSIRCPSPFMLNAFTSPNNLAGHQLVGTIFSSPPHQVIGHCHGKGGV